MCQFIPITVGLVNIERKTSWSTSSALGSGMHTLTIINNLRGNRERASINLGKAREKVRRIRDQWDA